MKKLFLPKLFCAAILLAGAAVANAQGVISTVAGTGTASYTGDGGAASAATFYYPSGVATDLAGNIYVADKYNSRVRKIDISTGLVSTFAGDGSAGYAGMGGPALRATLHMPNALFVDQYSNVFFTDWYNDAAFEVAASTDYIMNYCGHHTQGCTGDGGDASRATMEIPDGIWIDEARGNNAYIADAGNNRIRKVTGSGHIASTVCGGTYGFSGDGGPATAAAFNGIAGVCVDLQGNIYIADRGNNRIRMINPNGTITTFAGNGVGGYSGDGGQARYARFNGPSGLFVNSLGNLFVCDEGNHAIRVINTFTGIIKTLAGTGSAGFSGDGALAVDAQLNDPTAVWENETTGVIYIADAGNNRIRKIVGSGYRALPGETTASNTVHFDIYPNPSNGAITVNTIAVPANCQLEVYNMLGAKVYNQSITQEQTNLNLNLAQGNYLFVIKSAQGNTVQQITIVK